MGSAQIMIILMGIHPSHASVEPDNLIVKDKQAQQYNSLPSSTESNTNAMEIHNSNLRVDRDL